MLFLGTDIEVLFISIVGIILAIIYIAITLNEVIGIVLDHSFVNGKVNTYDKICKHNTKWLD